jgi:hypothetical protein
LILPVSDCGSNAGLSVGAQPVPGAGTLLKSYFFFKNAAQNAKSISR